MRKRLFSFIVCIVLSLTLLSGGAWAEVLIAGTDVSGGEYWKNNADNTGVELADAGTANAYYQGGTLYLNGLNVTSDELLKSRAVSYAICSKGDLTLNLSGSNSISTTGSNYTNAALYVYNGDLTVTGEGSLTATGGPAVDNISSGVNVMDGSLSVESGTLTGRGDDPANDSASLSGDSIGIYVEDDITASGTATVIGVGGDAQYHSHGVYNSFDKIAASDTATISGVSGSADYYCYGIGASNGVEASGSSVISGVAGSSKGKSIGINSFDKKIAVSDAATILGVGGNGKGESAGIVCQYGDVSYAGGTLIAKADAASKVSTAVSTRSLTLAESYYWRADEAETYKHSPEDEFTPSASYTYVELREELPPVIEPCHVSAPYYTYTVEVTDKGFLINADLDKFLSLRLDGMVLDGEDYTLTMVDGKLLITLDPDFLQALPKGEHTLFIYLADGFAEVKFAVE